MILLSDMIKTIATAIESSATVKAITDRFPNGYRLVVGHAADQELQAEDKRVVIAISFGDEPYDLGYAQERSATFKVRVSLYDNEQENDGVRELALGPLYCADLCHRIAEAVKGITGTGDDLVSAQASIDATAWPLTIGTTALTVTWPVALNSEATL